MDNTGKVEYSPDYKRGHPIEQVVGLHLAKALQAKRIEELSEEVARLQTIKDKAEAVHYWCDEHWGICPQCNGHLGNHHPKCVFGELADALEEK